MKTIPPQKTKWNSAGEKVRICDLTHKQLLAIIDRIVTGAYRTTKLKYLQLEARRRGLLGQLRKAATRPVAVSECQDCRGVVIDGKCINCDRKQKSGDFVEKGDTDGN